MARPETDSSFQKLEDNEKFRNAIAEMKLTDK
jgi:hypothetical protein